ncbi:MAG TPA: endolytic transglycosylase MltG [Chitinophagaceae bacterium]|nr:endolytic transglycosylase MltG [Chitinophagaceae bacterium]
MKKKIFFTVLLILLAAGGFIAWKFLGPAVHPPEDKYLYIPTGATYASVKDSLLQKKIIRGAFWYDKAAGLAGFSAVKPGRYEMKKGMSLLSLVRLLKNGRHTPVNFVITKIRTPEALAARIGRSFECDSLAMISYLTNADSLKVYGLDSATAMAAALPLTYTLRWNSQPRQVFEALHTAYKNFWNRERVQKAEKLGLTPVQVATLASIIDEETNAKSDKPHIASTYLNRLKKGMPLQADPTVKFALRNFALRRVLHEHLRTPSPYNTYLNKGLPPGPICTPMLETVDAVLDAPATDYLYFVANSNFDGTHIFTSDYKDHMKYAKLFHQALNQRNIK